MAIEALYIHVPFCASKCFYCDFDSRPCKRSSQQLDSYTDRMIQRIHAYGSLGYLSAVKTVFFGGGTPSLLSERLVDILRAIESFCSPEEVSFEANPDSLTYELALHMKQAGATRVSIGVQSFCDNELASVGRIHTADQARAAIDAAHRAGLVVSCDLMCGLPQQSLDSWKVSVNAAIECGVEHVSVYPLMVMENTPLYSMVEADDSLEPDEDLQADMMDIACEMFSQQGFDQYEVASYARPGCCCQHNVSYWTGVEYLGLGRSASSMISFDTYKQLVQDGLLPSLFEGQDHDVCRSDDASGPSRVRFTQGEDLSVEDELTADMFEVETLTAREAAAEDLMLGARLRAGIPYTTICRAVDAIGERAVFGAIHAALERDLLCLDSDAYVVKSKRELTINAQFDKDKFVNYVGYRDCGLKPTHKGWLLGNELFELFWNLAE